MKRTKPRLTAAELARRIAERDAAREQADALRKFRDEDRRDEAMELSYLTLLRKSDAVLFDDGHASLEAAQRLREGWRP